jgi:hypothetical protein
MRMKHQKDYNVDKFEETSQTAIRGLCSQLLSHSVVMQADFDQGI